VAAEGFDGALGGVALERGLGPARDGAAGPGAELVVQDAAVGGDGLDPGGALEAAGSAVAAGDQPSVRVSSS
jgi:hypothetical protein